MKKTHFLGKLSAYRRMVGASLRFLLFFAIFEVFWVFALGDSHDNFCRPLEDYGPRWKCSHIIFLKVFKIKLNLARISFLFSLSSLESYDPTILTLINFGRDVTRTDSMEERNVCSTNFEKSCELVEVKAFIIFQNQCLQHNFKSQGKINVIYCPKTL